MASPMLHRFASPAEVQRGCRIAHNWAQSDTIDAAKNGWTMTGTVPLRRGQGAIYPGTNGNYWSMANVGGWFNRPVWIGIIGFNPGYAANDGVLHYLCDSTAAARYSAYHDAANNLVFYLGNTSVLTVAVANYTNYWNQNGWNVLLFQGITANNSAFLNGNSIGTSATAWTVANPTAFQLGADNAGNNTHSGRIMFSKVFTGQIAADLMSAGDAMSYYKNEV